MGVATRSHASVASSSVDSESLASAESEADSEAPGLLSDEEEVLAPAAKGRGKAPLQRGLRQTLQERYGTGVVRARPAAAAAAADAKSSRTSAHEKQRLWTQLCTELREVAGPDLVLPTARSYTGWVESALLEGLEAPAGSRECRNALGRVRCARRVLGKWLKPRAAGGRCRRSPKEALAYSLMSAAEVLLGTYEGKARRCELTWMRYLRQELQGKLLLKEPKLTPAVRQQALEILDRVSNRQFGRPSM